MRSSTIKGMGCGHDHGPVDYGRAFAIGITLNTAYVVAEAGYGIASHSLALVADAGHNLSDVLGLGLGWLAVALAKRPPTPRRTYGLRRSSVLAALANAVLLLVAIGAIAWEAVGRFAHPEPVAGGRVMAVAAAGILVNGITAWLFASGRKGDLNVRAAFSHMMVDALVSLGVVLAGLAIRVTGATWIDPLASLVVAGLVGWGTWGLLRESMDLALDAVPEGIDPAAVRGFFEGLPEVAEVHDLHVWAMSTTETALTAHVVCPEGMGDARLHVVSEELHDRFGIEHATVQVERGDGCRMRSMAF